MNRIFSEGLIIIASFFIGFILLYQIDWIRVFNVTENTLETEEKLGKLFYEHISKNSKDIDKPFVINTIDSILLRITEGNSIQNNIQLHIVKNDEINAFALPGGHIMIYSGLIARADNPAEIAGILSHELAHIELDHVMKKLVKEVGLGLLISMAGGQSGTEILRETLKFLSSTAYDRKLEKQADLKAVDYLLNANIDPEPFANFLYKLEEEDHLLSEFSWLSTHPELKARAEYIIEYYQDKGSQKQPIISHSSWLLLQEEVH